jgi:hypothetical protein
MNKEIVAEIVGRFGTQGRLARALGHVNATTVNGWVTRGNIPSAQIPSVLAAAERLHIKLEPSDFFAATTPTQAAE